MVWFERFTGWTHIRCPFCRLRFMDDTLVPYSFKKWYTFSPDKDHVDFLSDLKAGHVFPQDQEYIDWLCQNCGGKVRISIKSKRCFYTHQVKAPKWYKPDCVGQQYFWDDLFL